MARWDDRLRDLVNEELEYLYDMGGEFDEQNPGVAPYLRLSNKDPQDPFVERLLDGFAFLSARVRLKLEDEFPRFVQSLLESVHPNYLSPTPAVTVVELTPKPDEGDVAEGYTIARDTKLKSARSDSEVMSTFLTKHEVTLWPIGVREASYHTSNELGNFRVQFPEGTRAAIRIKLETRLPGLLFNKMERLDRLTFYLKSMPRTPISVYEQLLGHSMPAIARISETETVRVSSLGRVGYDASQALFPIDPRCFDGYRLLREYFTLPERFLFFEISNLNSAVMRCPGNSLELIIPLRHEERALSSLLKAQNFALFCTPAINLFEESIRADIRPGAYEFPLIPRLHPEDYEVFKVREVTAAGSGKVNSPRERLTISAGRPREQTFRPFYKLDDRCRSGDAYFTTRRLDRRIERAVAGGRTREEFLEAHTNPRPRRERETLAEGYKGSDVYVALVDAAEAPFATELTSLTAECLCTNRGLSASVKPGEGTTDFVLDAGGPVVAIRCVDGLLSPPRASFAHGDFGWRLVNHLTVNYLSLSGSEEESSSALRGLLALYTHAADPDRDPLIQAIQSLKQRPKTHRIPTPGPLAFVRGLEVTIGVDERAFQGSGVFLLGAVLEQFLAKYVSINSFSQTVLETPQRGEVMRWPARIGRRQIL